MIEPSNTINNAIDREFLHPSKRRPHYLERISILNALRKVQHQVKPGLILDVGCGMKPYKSLLKTPDSLYYGTDYPITMEGSYGESTRADFFSDSTLLPFKKNNFDTVISTQMLEHVSDPKKVIQEIARILKPEGILILSAPMTWPLHEEPYDFFRYTIHGLRHLLQNEKFEILNEIPRGNNLSTTAQMFLDTQLNNLNKSFIQRFYSALLSLAVNQSCSVINLLKPNQRLCLGWLMVAKKMSAKNTTSDEH
jgi:SAM-dependent methyltransferase